MLSSCKLRKFELPTLGSCHPTSLVGLHYCGQLVLHGHGMHGFKNFKMSLLWKGCANSFGFRGAVRAFVYLVVKVIKYIESGVLQPIKKIYFLVIVVEEVETVHCPSVLNQVIKVWGVKTS